MKRLIIWSFSIILLVGGVVGIVVIRKDPHAGHSNQKNVMYHCPMHPTYTSDRPGDCPICGMRLVEIKQSESAAQAPVRYRHPLDPTVFSDVPMKDEMGLDYIPVYEKQDQSITATQVLDRAPITLTEEKRQLIGVRSTEIQIRELETVIRASGRVAYDPDLYNALIEYRQALEGRDNVKDSPWSDVRKRSEDLVRASAFRLRQMGLSNEQIGRLSAQDQDPTNLLLGEKGGSVWIYGQIYESEAALVKAGQQMHVTSAALPGRSFVGRVVAIDSVLNPETRTLRVRGEISNPDGVLKPEMFVDVAIHVQLGRQLALPEEAVMKTGQRQLVFVETVPGQYEPREVTLGQKAQNYMHVIKGLKEGEKVVTSANFLIDSESRLKASLSGNKGTHNH